MLNNDHRRLAAAQDLYHIREDAPGMVFWHPRGYALYRVLEDIVRSSMRSAGYAEVRSPQVLPISFWERSGHWDKFGASMFRASGGDGDEAFALKPMSCPCHIDIYNSRLRSVRDLPVRYAEFGACHRDEPSGSMHGLLRTKAFEQDDAHVLCAPEQVQEEVARFISMVRSVYARLGFDRIGVALSSRPADRSGSDADWDVCEGALAAAARAAGLEPILQPGEGAFYGPKLEFSLEDASGRSWQCGTVQIDMVLPGRLGASYVDHGDVRRVPIMIHHAVLGSMGRFLAILLEHHEGRLPFAIAPEQVAVIPVDEFCEPRAAEVLEALEAAGIRCAMFGPRATLGRRIVEIRELGLPVSVVIGRREVESGLLAVGDVRARGAARSMDLIDAIDEFASIARA